MADDPKKPEDDEEDEDEFDDEPVDDEDEDDDDDEDEDDEDDDEDSSRDRSRGRGTSVVGRLLEGVLSVPALTLGQRIGTDSESVAALLDKIEGVIGPMMTGMLITSVGSMTRMPRGFQQALVSKGVPRPVINVLNRLFEDVFEGIWAARRLRHAAKDEPLSSEDVKKGFTSAKEKVKKKGETERTGLMSALGKVDPAKRSKFLVAVGTLTGDAKTKFEYYRPLISKEAWLIEELADKPTDKWFPILEAVLGAPPKEKSKGGIATAVGKLTDRASAAVSRGLEEIVDKPKETMNEMARGVDQVTDGIYDLNDRLKARRDKARKRW
ncbi:hypothetical protein HZC53_01600 [Candidatus Uhrbacteria bacterium]|nr:hypothetical protein [Candidatus Uhrbacteria bacterium]